MSISYIDVGGKEANGQDIVAIAVDPAQGETVTVTNVSGDTITYYFDPDSGGSGGTIASSANQSFTQPVWLKSAGRSTVQVTGGKY